LTQLSRRQTQAIYETTVSTIENPPETAARLLEPQLEPQRARDFAQPQAHWPGAADSGVGGWRMDGGRPQRFRFGRAARIKQGRDFLRVRQEGKRAVNGCLIANWRLLPEEAHSRLGVVTGSKIGGAVQRNRARRLLREAFRLHQHDLTRALDLVLVARPSIAGKGFGEVERDFLTTLRKAGLLK